jgi:hypothetical protein
MAKNIAIGCLSVFLLVLAVGGYFGYTMVYRPIRQAANNLQQLEQLETLNRDVRNKNAYSAPASGELSREQLESFLQVQNLIQANLSDDVSALDERLKALDDDVNNLNDIRQVFSSLGGITDLLITAKEAQVEGLNQVGLSLDEYQWIRVQSLQALGMAYATNFQESIQSGGLQEVNNIDVPEANIALLEEYRDRFNDNLSFAVWGF